MPAGEDDLGGAASASSAVFGRVGSVSRGAEQRPLLPEVERRKSKMLLSVQADAGKGFVFAVRLSKWYIFYCALMALATLGLVIYMIADVHVKGHSMPIWAVAVDGVITVTLCVETALDIHFIGHVGVIKNFDQFVTILLLTCRYTAQAVRIIRFVRTGAEAQDVQTAVEEQPIIFDPHAASAGRVFGNEFEANDQHVRVDAM
ncbi:conserved hypothetical protein [Neospora caninum Liverpool]|uniref:Uncharacterized protein n=1 Tax=Neospora caninum (strain Liverpool) TaxID=572307 RepID=F0V9A5_NEOCL|nr:conserved hypothetical protein [Neospora caninum Liverpool]CBZ50330.1 conserved hypothetical protein [Neospora caninum Liverpool]|eukprot:XP_003880364.1 conserved hypothetical protein [Neospora caninum Liverpool]